MARLRRLPADESEPISQPPRRRIVTARTTTSQNANQTLQKEPDIATVSLDMSDEDGNERRKLKPKNSASTKSRKAQIQLAPKRAQNHLAGQPPKSLPPRDVVQRKQKSSTVDLRLPVTGPVLSLPSRIPSKPKQTSRIPEDSEEEVDIEESIWCGSVDGSESSSEEEDLPSLNKLFPASKRRPGILSPQKQVTVAASQIKQLNIFDDDFESALTGPKNPISQKIGNRSRPTSSSDKENAAIIRFSPPRLKSPHKQDPFQRPATPPQLLSPAKTKLKSPSKRTARIPTPPMRASLDAFWTAGAVNEWNDQYSPQKTLKSPRKLFFRPDSEDNSPTSSPRKPQTPTKRTKAELAARKDFESRKIALADAFLEELDTRITNGQIRQLAESTGGVQLIWSKTLNSTAGRANWRRETTKSKHSNGETSCTHKHFASIELATKVIDCEERLLNVIAHEFCHLANFMVSGIKDQPHGAQFKAWGKLCTKSFGDRGVEVTTKHTYEIEYKYIWQCSSEDCATLFQRHSKSIDPSRHNCGGCKSTLVQIKPVPRKQGVNKSGASSLTGVGGKAVAASVTGYAAYVKQHFAVLKKSMPGAAHKEVMAALGKKYRAEKAAAMLEQPDFNDLADAIAKDLERVKLGPDDDVVEIDSD